jgi:hypothetical protein
MKRDESNRSSWRDNLAFSGTGGARVESTVSCVLTRFRVRSPLSLIRFYISFCHVRRSSRRIAGLLQAIFLVENLHTCYTLSIWENEWAIVDFNTHVKAHIAAANSAFAPTFRKDSRAEIWSAQFRLWAVSRQNLNWEGFDLQTILGEQCKLRNNMLRTTNEEDSCVG